MKKIMLCAALFCALCSCTNEFDEAICQVEEKQVEANRAFFDESENDFANLCRGIIKVHIQIECFYSCMPESLAEKSINDFTLDEMVYIILLWDADENAGDILCEWPDMDDFWEMLPKNYREQYGISKRLG